MNTRQLVTKYWQFFLVLLLAAVLRFSGLLANPISLFSDEVDIGYQVQSFLKTGSDYQGNYLPLQFHSFSDVRTSLPIYATAILSLIPGISLDYAIRFTPALFSVLGIIGIYFLTNNLFVQFGLTNDKSKLDPGFWSALILTVLPWHFTYSRIGFELSMLFAFVTLGLYFYTKYLRSKQTKDLVTGLVLLSLTPMIYSTAKLAIVFYPLFFLLIPGSIKAFWMKKTALLLSILFIPVGIIFLNGGAGQRFSEISIFTDPTIPTEINFLRKEDLGPNAPVGSGTGLESKIIHNKVTFVFKTFVKNLITPISFDYLFLQGDTNPRHAVQGWGMLEKMLIFPLLFGLYKLAEGKKKLFLLLLVVFTLSSILPAALTRDGANHSSRNFMMVLPLVLLVSFGFYQLANSFRWGTVVILLLLFVEGGFYLHEYWSHYRFTSERSWSAGMREVMESVKKYPNQPVVVSPKYEHPLIFWMYYTEYDPIKFQQFVKSHTLYNSTAGKNNLEGNRIGDSNFYIATMVDYKPNVASSLPDAVYFLTRPEVDTSEISTLAPSSAIIRLPSGEPLYYEIHL